MALSPFSFFFSNQLNEKYETQTPKQKKPETSPSLFHLITSQLFLTQNFIPQSLGNYSLIES